ncbi:MAG: restriction endonuclease subunit M [Erysipelotrichaceae bacterium]|nr:restriction endonuclease subunit M [Erysipelotrichaceae bacterium]
MEKLIELDTYPVSEVLDTLLKDRTTGKNIIWATRSYESLGEIYTDKYVIEKKAILEKPELIQPRVTKTLEAQQARTKAKAEVFTPSWICNKMNNFVDEEWFGKKDVFNIEGDKTWTANLEPIKFPEGKKWKDYVESTRLEITCGEAPFIVSRYNAATGELIPVPERIGLLDRKLRIINENVNNKKSWMTQVYRAFKNVYGYEFQGDNLLIARINLFLTFCDYWREKWNEEAPESTFKTITEIITWNFWQMDGLNDCVPIGVPEERIQQLSLFGDDEEEKAPLCKIRVWAKSNKEKNKEVLFTECKKGN